ncbi:DUF4124 domain-containing protein [Burkholderiaceae bacterium DAT-1]|nr:DUF4124 domain-containing protein [Burkholderiaceae bacterium DAT-1]
MKAHVSTISFCLAALASIHVCADIYRSVDAEGHVTYSNVPSKGAKKIDLGNLPDPIPAPKPRASGSSGSSGGSTSYSAPTPSNFPRVDSSTQNARDQNRLSILQSEMDSEQRLLNQVRNNLQTSAPEKQAKLRDEVMLHEKNIEALKKEMSRAK